MITGASSGIGKAASLEIGQAGGTMLLVARRRDQLEEVAQQIEAFQRDRLCPYVRPERPRRHRPHVRRVLEQHEAVDILVNNAGKSIRRSVDRAYDRFHDYQRTMQLNYFGP